MPQHVTGEGCSEMPCSALLEMCLNRFETIQETNPEIALDAELSLLRAHFNESENPPEYHFSGEQWRHPLIEPNAKVE